MSQIERYLRRLFLGVTLMCGTASAVELRIDIGDAAPSSRVSFVELLSSGESYNGRRIQTYGFLRVDGRSASLELDRERVGAVDLASTIWLGGDDDTDEAMLSSIAVPSNNGRFALIEGVFTAYMSRNEEREYVVGRHISVRRVVVFENSKNEAKADCK